LQTGHSYSATELVEAPDGTNTALRCTSTAFGERIRHSGSVVSGQNYITSIWIRFVSGPENTVGIYAGSTSLEDVTLTSEWQKFTSTRLATGDDSSTAWSGVHSNGEQVIEIWQPQFEEGTTPTDYQRVGTTALDVTEAGKKELWYLQFDGVDDYMMTASVDHSGSDEMTMFVGLELATPSVNDTRMVLELGNDGNSTPGGAHIYKGGSSWIGRHRGDSNIGAIGLSREETPNVLMYTGKLSTDSRTLRNNTAEVIDNATDLGAGNSRNNAWRIGARFTTSASLFLDAKLFGAGAAGHFASPQTLDQIQSFLAARSGVTLP